MKRWWNAYRRWFDRSYLWPAMLREAESRDKALAGFRIHMVLDSAYGDLDEAQKRDLIDRLP